MSGRVQQKHQSTLFAVQTMMNLHFFLFPWMLLAASEQAPPAPLPQGAVTPEARAQAEDSASAEVKPVETTASKAVAATAPAAESPSGGGTSPAAAGSDGATKEDLERFRAALAVLETSVEQEDLMRAMQVLGDGFPKSRPLLHEGMDGQSAAAKAFILRILGERGEAKKDLEAAEKGLGDSRAKVRLAAGMAIRQLGKEGLPALMKYLPGEQNANNRKMAIKTLQHWGDDSCVPDLVRLLRKEKDRGVRNFVVCALERLTRRSFGQDLEAWQNYVEVLSLQAQARQLLKGSEPKAEVKP